MNAGLLASSLTTSRSESPMITQVQWRGSLLNTANKIKVPLIVATLVATSIGNVISTRMMKLAMLIVNSQTVYLLFLESREALSSMLVSQQKLKLNEI